VTVSSVPVPLVTAPASRLFVESDQSLLLTLPRSGKLLIQFSGVAYLVSAPDEAARFRYVLLVDGKPVPPSLPAIEIAPGRGGMNLTTTAVVTLEPGSHHLQVMGDATEGAVYATRNQSLTAIGPLQ
jgi:hypothetical protein